METRDVLAAAINKLTQAVAELKGVVENMGPQSLPGQPPTNNANPALPAKSVAKKKVRSFPGQPPTNNANPSPPTKSAAAKKKPKTFPGQPPTNNANPSPPAVSGAAKKVKSGKSAKKKP